jgi:hypothetical protein
MDLITPKVKPIPKNTILQMHKIYFKNFLQNIILIIITLVMIKLTQNIQQQHQIKEKPIILLNIP